MTPIYVTRNKFYGVVKTAKGYQLVKRGYKGKYELCGQLTPKKSLEQAKKSARFWAGC
jgi:hypothetical protein